MSACLRFAVACAVWALLGGFALAVPPLEELLRPLQGPHWLRAAIGVTRKETEIPAVITRDDLDFATGKTRVLLVAGLDGEERSVRAAIAAARWFASDPQAPRDAFALSLVPCGNPDGYANGLGVQNGSGGTPGKGFPPTGEAYTSPINPEAAYLWRWIGMHAPDLVLEVRAGGEEAWLMPPGAKGPLAQLAARLKAGELPSDDGLAAQLNGPSRTSGAWRPPSDTGAVPALAVQVANNEGAFLARLLAEAAQAKFAGPSPARKEIQRRLARSPLQVARELAEHYGRELPEAAYIPAMALVARLELADLEGGEVARRHLQIVLRAVEPYANGQKRALPEKPTSNFFSGHLLFGELARRTGQPRYLALAKAAADLGFDDGGQPREAMPAHAEMSDAVFMGCPILAQVGSLTGDAKYHAMCLRNLQFLQKLDLRGDGLYRHSPLNEAAWGRGNGFPALGMALSLDYLPEGHPARKQFRDAFEQHLLALVPHQDPTGAWRQVIDKPGSYRELTATCMITLAMARGVRNGWLPKEQFQTPIERGWYAIRTRVASDGTLVDVCTGTGKQQSLRDYYDRPAILGRDARGGALAFLAAVEIARYQATNASN